MTIFAQKKFGYNHEIMRFARETGKILDKAIAYFKFPLHMNFP